MSVLLRNNLRTLLAPYLITAIVIFLFALFYDLLGRKSYDALSYFIAIFVGSGTRTDLPLSEYFNGAIWFLLALFWCRLIFNGLLIASRDNQRILFLSSIAIALIGINASRYIYIPTNLLQGMGGVLFFSTGYAVKERLYRQNKLILPLSFIFCGLSMWTGSMSMVSNAYPNLVINYLGAVTTVYAIYHLSVYLSRFENCLIRLLTHIGRISILVLCVHDVHRIITLLPILQDKVFHFSPRTYILVTDVWMFIFPLIVSLYVYQFRWVRKVFSLS